MTKLLQRAMAEAARLPEAEQDRLGRELLAEVEKLRAQASAALQKLRPLSAADLDWLKAFRATLPPSKVDAGTFVSQMRDEDWR
jgi:hypothetical protein